ncbi:MAG TPA: ABC transporter permease [Bacteroidia bacterium]|nr:ABC transporter permease [Bacteroidia bacterium]
MSFNLYTDIANKLWQTKSQKKSIAAPVVKIAVGSIVLGIAVMILTVSIVTGFKNEIKSKAVGFSGDVVINAYTNNNSFEQEPLSMQAPFLKDLQGDKEIKHIQPFATKNAIIETKDENQGIIIKGVDNYYDWTFIKQYLLQGDIPLYTDTVTSDKILISKTMAQKLNARVGDKLLTYFISKKEVNDSAGEGFGYEKRVRKFIVSGVYQTGFADVDDNIVFAHLKQVQRLNYWASDQTGGFEVELKNYNAIDAQTEVINDMVGQNVEAKSVKQIYPTLFSWLSLLDSNAFIIITLMIVVAVINMISALLILILERSNTIGLLKSIGAGNGLVQKIFLYQSLRMLLKGLVIGNVAGVLICLVQQHFKFIKLPPESYYVSYVPVELHLNQILMVNLLTIGSCLVMMLLPVLIISKINPVKTLRFK